MTLRRGGSEWVHAAVSLFLRSRRGGGSRQAAGRAESQVLA